MTSYYALRGGDSSSDAYCGIFSVFVYYDDSYARWYLGAALSSLLHIILVVEVVLVMVPFVGPSLLLLSVLLLIQTGMLVLLYSCFILCFSWCYLLTWL